MTTPSGFTLHQKTDDDRTRLDISRGVLDVGTPTQVTPAGGLHIAPPATYARRSGAPSAPAAPAAPAPRPAESDGKPSRSLSGYARQKRRQARLDLYVEITEICRTAFWFLATVGMFTLIVVGAGVAGGLFPGLEGR
jgi:hypothetical protein